MNRVSNCFYKTADAVKDDLEKMFSDYIAFCAMHKAFEDRRSQAEEARVIMRGIMKFSSILPDNGEFQPQCSRSATCRKPMGHLKKCLELWTGSCRRPAFESKMRVEDCDNPAPALVPVVKGFSVAGKSKSVEKTSAVSSKILYTANLAEVIEWQKRHEFDAELLNSLCSRILRAPHDSQWYEHLQTIEAALTAKKIQRVIFLTAVIECAMPF